MKIKLLMLGVAGATLVFSCKKENKIEEECVSSNPFSEINFMPLENGNYWVYQQKIVDTLGNIVSSSPIYDTLTVLEDTTISGTLYKKLHKTNHNVGLYIPLYIRKHNGELISPVLNSTSGLFQGEENDFFSIFKDTLVPLYCINQSWSPNCAYQNAKIMLPNAENVTVPAGSFSAKNAPDIIVKNDNGTLGWAFWGTKRLSDYQFANNIGLIRSETFFISSTNTIVHELISYHLN